MLVKFPFSIDQRGRVASSADYDQHIVQLIEQVLFTAPGERPNRPDFGCGLLLLVFEPDDSQFAAANAAMIQASLGKWLGTLVKILDVTGQAIDSEQVVTVTYRVLRTGTQGSAKFRRTL